MKIAALFVYPVKSARGTRLDVAAVDRRGIRLDRRWMVVDEDGGFLTQRRLPAMALLEVSVLGDCLELSFPKMPRVTVPFSDAGPRVRATVWRDTCEAVLANEDASRWLREALRAPCRLVHMPDDFARSARDSAAARDGDQVGFADAFPFLLTSASSLAELNGRLDAPVPMDRFRPNLVVEGAPPFAEDGWKVVETSGLRFRAAKACARCAIVDVDQATGERGVEPLRTLATYRTTPGGAMFGVNLLHDGEGTLRTGAELVVVS